MSTTAKTNTLSNMDALQWPTEERIRWVEQAICHSPTINGWDIAGYAAFNIKPINTATLAKSFVLGPVEFPEGAAFYAEDEHKQLYHHPKDWLTNLKALPVDHARSYMRTSLLICSHMPGNTLSFGRGEILTLLETEFRELPYRLFLDYERGRYQGINRIWVDFVRPH